MRNPNFFIAVKINNNEIGTNVEKLQQSLCSQDTGLCFEKSRRAFASVKTLHFTLFLTRLEGDKEIKLAKKAFLECCEKIKHEVLQEPLDLKVAGLGCFGDQVLFAKLKEEKQISCLTQMWKIFCEKFEELGLPHENRNYSPHITIINLRHLGEDWKQQNIRLFPPGKWPDIKDFEFGTEVVKGLQLLKIKDFDTSTGYYKCYADCVF